MVELGRHESVGNGPDGAPEAFGHGHAVGEAFLGGEVEAQCEEVGGDSVVEFGGDCSAFVLHSAHVVCVAFDFHACLDLALAHDQEHDDACDGHQQEAEEQERLPLAEDVFLQLAVGQACGHGVVADFEFGQRLLHAARGQAVGPHHGGVAIGVRQVVVAETGIAAGDHAVGAVEWLCHAVVAGGEELIEGLAVVAVLHVVADAH